MPAYQQLLDYYRLVRRMIARHWRLGAAVFAAVALLAFIGTLLMPRTYYSEARLFVRFGRENQVDPTASGGQMVALYESRESEINSLIEILRSRAILDRVVAELGPEYVLSGSAAADAASVHAPADASADAGSVGHVDAGGSDQAGPPSKAHQMAVLKLSKELSIAAPRKSNIIAVACKASSPAAAQRIVTKLVDVYREEHVRVHRSPASYEFFEQQAAQSLAAWHQAAEELRQQKDRLGIVTIEGRSKNLEEAIADVDFKRQNNQAELRSSRAKIASLENQCATLPETIVTQEVESQSAAADGMRQTLYSLEAQEQDLAAKMQEGHPRLVAIRQQVRDLKNILAGQPRHNIQATEALNPSRQALEASLLAERSQAEALAARDRSLVAGKEQLMGELKELNARAIGIDELQQRVTLAEANHKDYAQRLEQARINRTLDEERITSLSLVQPASYAATPGGPRRAFVLALGLIMAALSGVAAVAVAAWLNPLIRTAEQLAAALDVPLIGSLHGALAAG
jgi:uncharacterized protein involved in exopolysaccharide biosynthesis